MRAWPRRTIALHAAASVVLAAVAGLALAVAAPAFWGALGLLLGAGYYASATQRYRRRRRVLTAAFPTAWRDMLLSRVEYYRRLPLHGRRHFEDDVAMFLAEQRISAERGARLEPETPVLIAAGAAILGHHLPDWEWDNVRDILVYPDAFDEQYRFNRQATLVGQVAHQGPVILSQPRISEDFRAGGGDNVVLHELAHVIDFADGHADGAPPGAEQPWSSIIANRVERVRARRGALRDYAGKNEAELFAVAVEAFFGESERLKNRDPVLYRMLSLWFDQDPAGSGEASFPGRPEGARTLSGEEEPWARSLAWSDVSHDPAAIDRVRDLRTSEPRDLGFEPLGIARAVSFANPARQSLSCVLGAGVMVATVTAGRDGPRIELGTLFEDGSIVKSAPGPAVREHADDGFERLRARGSFERALRRHRARVREIEEQRGAAPVAADSMATHFAIELRAGELRDARRPAELRVGWRVACIGSVLLALAIWAPFGLAARARPSSSETAPVLGVEAPRPRLRAWKRDVLLPQWGLMLAVLVAVGAFPLLRRAAVRTIARDVARLTPGPRRPDAAELMVRVAKTVAPLVTR